MTGLREKMTRRGEKMANWTLEDLEGTVDVIVFPRKVPECREALASPEPVFLVGRLSIEEQGVKILTEEIFRMENVRERLAKSVHFHLLLDRMGPGDIAELRRTILRNAGEKKGFLHVIRPGEFDAVIALPDGCGVAPSLELARDLRAASATTSCRSTDASRKRAGSAPSSSTRTGSGLAGRRRCCTSPR